MTKQERAEFTIDYIRNRTEGVPDEFLPDISIALQEGMRFGRTRRHFYYDGKWYKSLKKFLEAIKDVEFKEE